MRITNTQKNELAHIVEAENLKTHDFELSGQLKEFKVKYKHDYFSFSINKQKTDSYNLTIFSIHSTSGSSTAARWIRTKAEFTSWIKAVAGEINAPSRWNSFEGDAFQGINHEALDEEFTEEEKVNIKESIKEFRSRIKTLEISKHSIALIARKLDDVESQVEELKKFDWLALFFGTLAGLVLTLSIPPEASGLLWEYARNVFNGLKLKGK